MGTQICSCINLCSYKLGTAHARTLSPPLQLSMNGRRSARKDQLACQYSFITSCHCGGVWKEISTVHRFYASVTVSNHRASHFCTNETCACRVQGVKPRRHPLNKNRHIDLKTSSCKVAYKPPPQTPTRSQRNILRRNKQRCDK